MSSHHFWLSDDQFASIQPCLPNKPYGVPRVDDRRVISGIIHVIRNGLMWCDAPERYGPHKTHYNRFVRWSQAGVFNRIFAELTASCAASDTVMIDATHLKAHRTATSLLKKGPSSAYRALQGRPELQAARALPLSADCRTIACRATNGEGKPLILLLTEGQVSDDKGAAYVLPALPDAEILIADRGYDADWFRTALEKRSIEPCIPGRKPFAAFSTA